MKRGILVLTLLVSGAVSAQGYDGRLTLTEAIDYAHHNSATAKIAERDILSGSDKNIIKHPKSDYKTL